MLPAQTIARRAVKRSRSRELYPFYYPNPADFLEAEMVIPETGLPITLHPEQRAVIEAMSARDERGYFLYNRWLYSAPKKTAKTTLGAGIALWHAWQVKDGEVYIIGNDLRQATNRMFQAIEYAIEHNSRMVAHAKIDKHKIQLTNGTKIESLAVDPAGEAGMNPTAIFWTELWGATQEKHMRMWSEAALSPTRIGYSFIFAESYAGFSGQSLILEQLYNQIIKEGTPHPDAPELFTNGAAIGYWCTRRYLPWQNGPDAEVYYASERLSKIESEFDRQHNNHWQSATEAFLPSIEWWDACKGDVPLPDKHIPCVIAMDAGIDDDCFGILMIYRRGDQRYVPYARKWTPPKGGKIQFSGEGSPEEELRRLIREYNVIVVEYDKWQLHDMATRLASEGNCWFHEFSQAGPRAVADKFLYDTIKERRITHSGDVDLREHLANADAKKDGEKLRLVKRTQQGKIDLAVCASMANARAMELNIG